MRRLTILLPPSEGKAPGGDGGPWAVDDGRFGVLAPQRAGVAAALSAVAGGNAKLLGARGDLLDRAREANQAVVGAATMPAWRRFTGVVWESLGAEELRGDVRRRAASAVVVVSALTGLTGWNDAVPDFRLKLSVSLGELGRLDRFWREPLSAVLNRRLAGRTVIDLLPNEHRAAWTPAPDRYELIRPHLVKADGRPGGHDAKAAKGRLVRALLEGDDAHRVMADFDAGPLRLDVERVAAEG